MVPDIADWRRERMPTVPDVPFFTLAPDWVCEVLSPSTEHIDRGDRVRAEPFEAVELELSALWIDDTASATP